MPSRCESRIDPAHGTTATATLIRERIVEVEWIVFADDRSGGVDSVREHCRVIAASLK
jgi:hypothetical protein